MSEAVDILETIRGVQRLGLTGFSIHDLTARQFHLVSYLSSQIEVIGSNKRKK